MAKQPDSPHIVADTGAKFVPAATLPAPTQTGTSGDLLAALRRGAKALTRALLPAKVEPVRLPQFVPLQVVLKPDPRERDFTVASTVEHWQKGTANSQIPQQEYLLSWLRRNQHIKLEAAKTPEGQDVLQFNVPRYADQAAIRKHLTIYHPGAIEKVLDTPEAAQPGRPGALQGKPGHTPAQRM